MSRRALLAALLAALPAAAAPDDDLARLREDWAGFDRARRIDACTRLLGRADARVLRTCEGWLRTEEDPAVEGQLLAVIAAHAGVDRLRPRAVRAVTRHAERRLDERAAREQREFEAVCREHGRRIPPGGAQGAGRDWQDPWDEERRTLPEETRHERIRARGIVAALQRLGPEAGGPGLLRVFAEHHDPEVLVACVRAFGALQLHAALPAMADLARIQEQGRRLGGADVIGRGPYETRRLKWDVHKDRLWWSRPEYVPRVRLPILAEAGRIAGRDAFGDVRALDRWILSHARELEERGVELSAAFRSRAAGSAR